VSWHDAANWAGDALPGAGDAVCIPDQTPDVTVTLAADVTTSVQSIQSAEALDVAAGVLLLDDQTTRTASLAPRLILSGGVLAGNGCLTIQELLDWRAGWIGRGQDDFGGVFLGTTTMISSWCASRCASWQSPVHARVALRVGPTNPFVWTCRGQTL
jgi:hypothetical protein